jgi:ParB/RepB/Spo0J family partition protein
MNQHVKFEHHHLPIEEIHANIDHTPASFGEADIDQWLIESILQLGILSPIAVMRNSPDGYVVIEGHRRYLAACELSLKTVPCFVRPKLSPGEYELLRRTLHMNHKPLTPAKRKGALKRLESLVGRGKLLNDRLWNLTVKASAKNRK